MPTDLGGLILEPDLAQRRGAAQREVHVAGLPGIRGDQIRQRCVWCGLALIDTTLDETPDHPGALEAGIIQIGAWVAIDPLGFATPVGHISGPFPTGYVPCGVTA